MTARLQLLDRSHSYYILFEGTDRLEGLFSHVRTQDHTPNFDILQLSHKLSIATESNVIYERHPDLDCGHFRRNLVNAHGIDHINPKSWIGDVVVGNVNVESEWLAGRDQANTLLEQYLVLPKFSSVQFSPHFLRTENRTDRIFSELNRTRIELVRTGSNRRTGQNCI